MGRRHGFGRFGSFQYGCSGKARMETCSKLGFVVGESFARKVSSHMLLGNFARPRVSYAWRSIWEASGLLLRGLCWRIGNGKDFQVRGDRWFLTPYSFQVTSTNPILKH